MTRRDGLCYRLADPFQSEMPSDMDDLDTRDMAESVRSALRKRIIALPEEAEASDYVAVMAQVRALRALVQRLHVVQHELDAAEDPLLASEQARLTEAVALITREMGR